MAAYNVKYALHDYMVTPMELNEIRERLKQVRTIDVCASVGISRQALWLIKSGKTRNPSAKVVDALRNYLVASSCS